MSYLVDKITSCREKRPEGQALNNPVRSMKNRAGLGKTHTQLLVIHMKKNARSGSPNTSGSSTAAKSRRSPSPAASPAAVGSAQSGSAAAGEQPVARWTFLTNHSHVLILISRNPSVVLRQVALQVGITERAVQRIIADLEEAGIIEREKVGRQNHYRIMAEQPLRHSVESHRTIADLLSLMQVNVG